MVDMPEAYTKLIYFDISLYLLSFMSHIFKK